MAENKNINPFNPYNFNEGCAGERNYVAQTEQRNAKWVDDAKGHEDKYVANGIETFFGKEAPTTQLFNVCAIECPENCEESNTEEECSTEPAIDYSEG